MKEKETDTEKQKPFTLSDLLAHRDGEPLELAVAQRIEESEEARELLTELRASKHALRELPGIEPPPDAWEAIQSRVQAPKPQRTVRFPLATAAATFLAAAIGIMAINPLQDDGQTGLNDLMSRSQQLESEVALPVGFGVGTPSQQALAYRIADIDTELVRLYEQDSTDRGRRAELWQQRVELLENLQAVQRSQALRPAVY